MQDVAKLDLVRLKTLAAQDQALAPAMLKAISVNERGSPQRVVFRVRRDASGGGGCALKCFVHRADDSEVRARVRRETVLAEWASREKIGAPVHSVTCLPELTILAMTAAVGDLEGILRSRQQLTYTLIKDLLDRAFLLAAHEKLISKGRVCADLKPANFLVFVQEARNCIACDLATVIKKGGFTVEGSRWDLKLVDFDPFFWSKTHPHNVARLNTFFLLANTVLWKAPCGLATYMPDAALRMAAAVCARDPSLVELLLKHMRLLRKGPCHYAHLPHECEAPLETLLVRISDALVLHGFEI